MNQDDLAPEDGAAGALSPLIGRRAEVVAITRVLLQSRKNNLILIGEPGVGKTGVVEGFAQIMADGSLPKELDKHHFTPCVSFSGVAV